MALSLTRLYLHTPAVTRGYVTACVLTTAAVVRARYRGTVLWGPGDGGGQRPY